MMVQRAIVCLAAASLVLSTPSPQSPGIGGWDNRLRTGKRGSLVSVRPNCLDVPGDHRDDPHLPARRMTGMRALRGAYVKLAVVAAIVSLALASGACKKWA